ncbi:N(4)-acetylcytidine aminohydrolase [Vibrio sp. Of7-15]|uniref:N(4)-acetylcytidine aminohydrolase n=1 Tax=Vibrio sp. Of7-15 TaxID=2724879 RepID=UPI001EF1D788|nr:N(4)-acetylcytidine aminohydrolase [Vibrio sp. Of7-15]MCG7496139.1 N(4)-acetylcytidine aminohydrolase [Vibrio sp. Of7-15]
MTAPTSMLFFERFESDIVSGKKTITIRDESECDYVPGSTVRVFTLEDNREFCQLKIISVVPVLFDELTQFHADQENMTLDVLKEVIREIYPNTQQLYVVSYRLVF